MKFLVWSQMILLAVQMLVVIAGLAMFKRIGYNEGFEDATNARIYMMELNKEEKIE